MVSIGRKNLFHDWTRFLISAGGVAFSIFLMLYVVGLYQGVNSLLEAYVSNQDADLWVVEEGKTDFFRGSSFLPLNVTGMIKSNGAVKDVYYISTNTVKFDHDNKKLTLIIIGYDTSSGFGGPWKIIEGKSKPDYGEIIIDNVFAKKNNIVIGDVLTILDKEFRVVGISDSTSVLLWQYAFINYQDSEILFNLNFYTNYVMVTLRNPQFTDSVMSYISDNLKLNVFTKQEFVDNNKQLISEGFTPILLAVLIIGMIVGSSFVALTIYTITVEKIKEYGVLKAIGSSNKQLYGIIFEQSLTSSLIGFLIGVVTITIVNSLTFYLIPEINVLITFDLILYMLLISVLISLIASYIPIRRVSKVDPLMVFK